MAGWWRGWTTLLLLVLCSVSLCGASDVDALQELNHDFSSRKLLQVATPPPVAVPVAAPPPVAVPVAAPPPVAVPVAAPPTQAPVRQPPTQAPVAPVIPPVRAPAPAPVAAPAPPTPARTYLMWIGIGAFCLVLVSVAVFCLCRKFGQQKIRGAQRLPPLPRYH